MLSAGVGHRIRRKFNINRIFTQTAPGPLFILNSSVKAKFCVWVIQQNKNKLNKIKLRVNLKGTYYAPISGSYLYVAKGF